MYTTKLFEAALGVMSPWRVVGIEFEAGAKDGRGRLDIRLDFERGGELPCPECKQPCKERGLQRAGHPTRLRGGASRNETAHPLRGPIQRTRRTRPGISRAGREGLRTSRAYRRPLGSSR
ncbi:MAG: hypothetical protein K8T90_10325 [Planctomycetes bacterium]|nr:hypothetical protein [Planctomycetota bacterium]